MIDLLSKALLSKVEVVACSWKCHKCDVAQESLIDSKAFHNYFFVYLTSIWMALMHKMTRMLQKCSDKLKYYKSVA